MDQHYNISVAGNIGLAFRYRVIIHRDEDDVFIAECPALPGCVTDGATFEEALAMVKDAIHVYVAAKMDLGEAISSPPVFA